MILASTHQGRVSLAPVAYEFPAYRAVGPGLDWDANWLMIRGEVHHPDGSTWTFTDPCLTTFEARELGDWLHTVAADEVTPQARGEDLVDVCFTEPNLAFTLLDRDETRCVLAVHFSFEALPPWRQGFDRPGIMGHAVHLSLTRDDLLRAVQEWRQELRAFPVR